MKIVLGRHGKPKLGQWRWIAPQQLLHWIHAFNEADILVDRVPPHTATMAARCKVIVSSPLRRSVQSAQLLASSRPVLTEELFREAGMPHTRWRAPRLPVSVWLLIFRLAWFCGYSFNAESLPSASTRARLAANRLVDLAQQHESVFVAGHGIMTMLIARQLLLLGWSGPKRPGNKYWEYRVYCFPA